MHTQLLPDPHHTSKRLLFHKRLILKTDVNVKKNTNLVEYKEWQYTYKYEILSLYWLSFLS